MSVYILRYIALEISQTFQKERQWPYNHGGQIARRVKEGTNHLQKYKNLRGFRSASKITPPSPEATQPSVECCQKGQSHPALSQKHVLGTPFCWHRERMGSLSHEATWKKTNQAEMGKREKKSDQSAGSRKMPLRALQTDNRYHSHCALLTVTTSNELNIHSGCLKNSSFSYTAQHLI